MKRKYAERPELDLSWFVEQEKRIAEATARGRHGRRPDKGQLYVVEFTSGVIKVGRATRARTRIAAHAGQARVHGGGVRRSWASERHAGYEDTERQLIAMCKQLGELAFGHEYFRDVRFESACEYATLVITDRRRREYLDRLIAASGGDLSTVWQVAHERAYGGDPVSHLRVVAA